MLRILWLAPNFNHYKARFLNHLAEDADINLTIMSGTGRDQMGDQEIERDWSFKKIKLNVTKKDFGKSKIVKEVIKPIFKDFDWVLIPAEKKNLPLFLYALKLRRNNSKVRLFSYNHAQLKSKNSLYALLDNYLTKFFYKKLDRVIFYTENACKTAEEDNLIKKDKAFWANNTIDNTEIQKHYSYKLPPEDELNILFIGRLIPSKRVADLINYFNVLKQKFPNLKLDIIGDGPDSFIVKSAIDKDKNITWFGTLVDEAEIAPIMRRAALVFVPGLSGLSINHAFAYGRPYVTLKAEKHGPEISYINQDKNGYILNGIIEDNILKISGLLKNRNLLNSFCDNAKVSGDKLSVSKWVQQMKMNLLHD